MRMYVCICNAVRESTLETAVEKGLSFAQFRAQTGCASTCGTCMEDAETLFNSAKRERSRFKGFSLPILLGA
jgi:bacterioferritin-associated ferredoxin